MVYGGKEPENELRGRDRNRNNTRTKQQARDTATAEYNAAPPANTGIGTMNYANTYGNYSNDELPEVSDPDAAYSQIAEDQYASYVRNYRDYENSLIESRNSTDIIDAAREDTPQQIALTQGIAQRNRQRYGYQQTGAEAQESQRAVQRGGSLAMASGVNNARLAQRDANQKLLGDLINIGQGVNRSSLSQMGSAASNAASRQQAYQNDKTAYKQQTAGFLGSLGKTLASFI